MPEPIQASGLNLCLFEEPEELGVSEPRPATSQPARSVEEWPTRDQAVSRLVSEHARSVKPPLDCSTEGVALATAGIKTAVSLAAVVLAAPSEVGLPITIGKFLVDAVGLGAAAAQYENCRDAVVTAKK